jgi:cobalt-zinc-cadmium efflux system membrane fusion protein
MRHAARLIFGVALVARAENVKPPVSPTPEHGDDGIELSAASAKFVEIAPVTPQTDGLWGRAIPGRVSLQPSARMSVGALVEGRVEAVLVRPGDRVEAGAPLLRLQSLGGGQARAEAELAAARLEAAEENLRRYSTMVAKGVATDVERIEAEVKLREAKIELERTRKTGVLLGNGSGSQLFVDAPTNGIVLAITGAVGSVISAGNEVVELGDPSRLWIEADVTEDDAARFAIGQRARVESLRGGNCVEATIEVLTTHLDSVTRRRRVYLKPVTESLPWLALGLPVEVRLSEPADQIVLPTQAVLIKEGKRRIVYVQSADGKLHAREVAVSAASQGRVRVLNGISLGERVVVKGALLVDGRSEQLL